MVPRMPVRPRILFLCMANACRSQIAAGLLERLASDRFEVLSAGVKPAGFVHDFSSAVVAEAGGDLSAARSKSVEIYAEVPPDLLVSLCPEATRHLRRRGWTGRVIEWPTPDPITVAGPPDVRLQAFRYVRDELLARLESALATSALERAIEEDPDARNSLSGSGFASLRRWIGRRIRSNR
jgi:arsenate reductase